MKRILMMIGSGLLTLNAFSVPPGLAECVTPSDGLVGWWQGEGSAIDLINGDNGILINGVGFASGKVGFAFDFNGVNQYILINPTNSVLDVGQNNGLTIEGWIKPTKLTTSMQILEFERGLGTSSGSDVGVQFSIDRSPPGAGSFNTNLKDITGADHVISSVAGLIANGVWQHVAVSYDKVSGATAFYLNGVAIMQTNLGSFTP